MRAPNKPAAERKEKYVLITGASSGIGLVTALKFAINGWHVVAVTRTGEKGRRAVERIKQQSGSKRVIRLTADF